MVRSLPPPHRLRAPGRHRDGFGLIELIVTVAVIAILLAVALLNLHPNRFEVNQAAEGLARDFQLARFEAIRRNEFVGLRIDAGADRYQFLMDLDRNDVLDAGAGDTVIKTVDVGGEHGVDVVDTVTFVFDTRGVATFLASTAITLTNRSGDYPKTVCVSAQGQARVVSGTTCP